MGPEERVCKLTDACRSLRHLGVKMLSVDRDLYADIYRKYLSSAENIGTDLPFHRWVTDTKYIIQDRLTDSITVCGVHIRLDEDIPLRDEDAINQMMRL